jgi:Notch-like protein
MRVIVLGCRTMSLCVMAILLFFASSAEADILMCFGLPFDDPAVCTEHGVCIAQDTCDCLPGWAGSDCSQPTCFGLPGSDPGV